MTRSIRTGTKLATIRISHVWMAALVTASLVAGCVQPPPTDTSTSPSGDLSGTIALFSNLRISGSQPITIVYSASAAATSVSAFYIQVASTDANAPETGSEVVFATGLGTGTNQAVALNTGDLPQGIFRVGLTLTNDTDTLRVLSTGTIQIAELPTPVFTLPDQSLSILTGQQVEIRATLGDPENAVQWRIFYMPANESTSNIPADKLGTEIAVGAASVANKIFWLTGGIPLGSYRIGISVTDSGSSIADTVAAGGGDGILTVLNEFVVEIVDQEPAAQPPSVVVSQPSSDTEVLKEGTVLVEYSVTAFEGPPNGQTIRVFYDKDGTADTGDEKTISDNLPISTQGVAQEGSVVFAAALINDDDTVFFGVTVDDGKNAPVTRYAKGKATRVKPEDAILTVIEPDSPLPKKPGEEITVRWQVTGLPTSAKATTNVLVQRTDAANLPVSTEISTTGLPLTTTSWKYDTDAVGRFLVTVEIVFDDTTSVAKLTGNAEEFVVVSTTPAIFWMGELLKKTPAIKGAIFEGVQFEDNAGSSFAGGTDFDEDGLDDFVIVSRYGKPNFVNPSGIGVGEAYFIRGKEERFSGRFNLNSTASATLPGFVLTGISVSPSDETDGIASAFITADSDGDGVGELAFGFPNAWSFRIGELGGHNGTCGLTSADIVEEPFGSGTFDPIPHFRRGGAVVYSSQNFTLATSGNDTFDDRISLDGVGQSFPSTQVGPEPDDGGGDICLSSWMADQLIWIEPASSADCGVIGCFPGSDGAVDTLVKPNVGFSSSLATQFVCLQSVSQCVIGQQCPSCDVLCDPDEGSICTCDISANISDPANALPLCSATRVLLEASSIATTCDPETSSGTCPLNSDDPPVGACECKDRVSTATTSLPLNTPLVSAGGTGYYIKNIAVSEDGSTPNRANDGSMGARYLGLNFNDAAASSMSQSRGQFITVSPFSTIGNTNGGTAFLRGIGSNWDTPTSTITVKPHQYHVSGFPTIFGDTDELIEEVEGIPDFNEDGRVDIAVGAPRGDVDQDGALDGAVYILYRRAASLEGDYDLAKLKLDTNNVNRLEGLLVRETFGEGQRFGVSIAGDFDFNDDGVSDVVVGNPDGNDGTGEVVIIFGSALVQSQQNGIPVEDDGQDGLLTTKQGARIRGIVKGDEFGIYVVNVGDLDGDGKNDLAIAAPNATPYFDSDLNDDNDSLDPNTNPKALAGLDADLDGVMDDVTGPDGNSNGLDDPNDPSSDNTDANDELRDAGLVYIILSSTMAENFNDDNFNDSADPTKDWLDISIDKLGGGRLDGFILVGRRGQRFEDRTAATLAHEGDFLGGGNAGFVTRTVQGRDIRYGGNTAKAPEPILKASNDPADPRTLTDGTILERDRGHAFAIGRAGDVDGDGFGDLLIGAPLADPRVDPVTSEGARNGGEAYLIYGFSP